MNTNQAASDNARINAAEHRADKFYEDVEGPLRDLRHRMIMLERYQASVIEDRAFLPGVRPAQITLTADEAGTLHTSILEIGAVVQDIHAAFRGEAAE